MEGQNGTAPVCFLEPQNVGQVLEATKQASPGRLGLLSNISTPALLHLVTPNLPATAILWPPNRGGHRPGEPSRAEGEPADRHARFRWGLPPGPPSQALDDIESRPAAAPRTCQPIYDPARESGSRGA